MDKVALCLLELGLLKVHIPVNCVVCNVNWLAQESQNNIIINITYIVYTLLTEVGICKYKPLSHSEILKHKCTRSQSFIDF